MIKPVLFVLAFVVLAGFASADCASNSSCCEHDINTTITGNVTTFTGYEQHSFDSDFGGLNYAITLLLICLGFYVVVSTVFSEWSDRKAAGSKSQFSDADKDDD